MHIKKLEAFIDNWKSQAFDETEVKHIQQKAKPRWEILAIPKIPLHQKSTIANARKANLPIKAQA